MLLNLGEISFFSGIISYEKITAGMAQNNKKAQEDFLKIIENKVDKTILTSAAEAIGK